MVRLKMISASSDGRLAAKAFCWFLLSMLFTWLFISQSPMYISKQQQWLSGSIAGAKWAAQIGMALLFLKNKKWIFIQKIGLICLLGSVTLLPYYFLNICNIPNSDLFFVGSIMVAVVAMVFCYFIVVKKMHIGLHWWWGWLICLAIAIFLQLTVVFNVLKN